MSTSFTTENLIRAITFPFADPKWKSKLLIGLAISVACFFIPLLPAMILYGYAYQIMHQVIVDKTAPSLPEWTDWGKLLTDGFKLFGVYFIYMLPTGLVYSFGMVSYMIGIFGITASDPDTMGVGFPLAMFAVIGILYVSMFIAIILSVFTSILMPAAVGHMVARDSFAASFDIKGWWKILRANPGAYLLGMLVIYGLVTAFMLLFQVLYLTMFVCCLLYLIAMAAGVYMMMVIPALVGYMYNAGQEKLTA